MHAFSRNERHEALEERLLAQAQEKGLIGLT